MSNIILKNKKIYYFDTFPSKNTLKNNRNQISKHTRKKIKLVLLSLDLWLKVFFSFLDKP